MDYTKDLLVIIHKVKAALPEDEAISKSMSSLLNMFEKVRVLLKIYVKWIFYFTTHTKYPILSPAILAFC